jgi:hypothetical protein
MFFRVTVFTTLHSAIKIIYISIAIYFIGVNSYQLRCQLCNDVIYCFC